jgi:O-acetylhomoserine/O-acetylserine sulfhydrylase
LYALDEAVANEWAQDLIRISVGTEHIDDIVADFEQSFAASATKPEEKGDASNAGNTGTTETQGSLSGST